MMNSCMGFALKKKTPVWGSRLQNIINLTFRGEAVAKLVWANCAIRTFCIPALLPFIPVSLISIVVCKQSAGFSGASDATRVSILLGLLKVHVNTFAASIWFIVTPEKDFSGAIYDYIITVEMKHILFLILVQTIVCLPSQGSTHSIHWPLMMLWFPYHSWSWLE